MTKRKEGGEQNGGMGREWSARPGRADGADDVNERVLKELFKNT